MKGEVTAYRSVRYLIHCPNRACSGDISVKEAKVGDEMECPFCQTKFDVKIVKDVKNVEISEAQFKRKNDDSKVGN